MTQLRRYLQSGEVFACDPVTMTMTGMLAQNERNEEPSDYELDHDMEPSDLEKSVIIRHGLARAFQHDTAWMVQRDDGMYAVAADSDINDLYWADDAVVGEDAWGPTIAAALGL